MSQTDVRSFDPVLLVRHALALTVFAMSQGIQLALAALWMMRPHPLTSGWMTRVFPEGAPFVVPERETALMYLAAATTLIVFTATAWLLKRLLKSAEFFQQYGFPIAVEAALTFLLLSAGFQIIVYSYRPQLAQDAFGVLLTAALLHKFFWKGFRDFWGECTRVCFDPHNQTLLRTLVHAAMLLLIILIIYVPNPVAAVARLFFGEQFHHWDLGLVGAGWAFQTGCRLNVDTLSQYGVGMPIIMSILAKAIGGFTYPNVMVMLVWSVIIYYLFYYLLLRAWLQDRILITIFGILTVLRLQVFHSGILPFTMTYPMTTPFRWWFDIVFFWMMYFYFSRRQWKFLAAAAIACGASIFHMIDTGAYLTAAFYFYLFLSVIIPQVREEYYPRKSDYVRLGLVALTVPVSALFLFWLVEGHEIFRAELWQRTMEFAYYYINGLGLEPIHENLRQGYLFSTAMGLVLPAVYVLTVLGVAGLCFYRKIKSANLFVVIWCIYGLASFQYYVVHSTESSYYVYVIPFVTVVCYWYKQLADRVKPSTYHRMGMGLVVIALYALVTNHYFVAYPNLLNVSRNPIVDPLVYKIPPGRPFYFHHLYRQFPDNFKLAKNSLGEFDEKLVAESDFRSDDQLAAYFQQEFDFSTDAKLIQKYTGKKEKVALLSSFETAILMQADRAPYFKYFPNLNSRPLRMRIFPVSSIPSKEHLHYTIKQLAEGPPYVFMERIFLNRSVPGAYYHDSPELMEIINFILDHFEPVEEGRYLVAMKWKG